MNPFRPLIAKASGKIKTFRVADHAAEIIELAPAIQSDRPKAIFDEQEIPRIDGFYEAPEFELSRVNGGPRREGATVAYALDDVIVSKGAVYKAGGAVFIGNDTPRFTDFSKPEREASGVLATNMSCEKYFGDWLTQGLGLRLLADEWGLPAFDFARTPWMHQPGYEQMTNLGARSLRSARVDRLWIVDDRGMNQSRGSRLRELRRRIRAAVTPTDPPRKVFLHRGQLGKGRSLVNESEVTEFARRAGFTIVNPERCTPQEIAAIMHGAEVVMTVEGSTQIHALLAMPPGSTLLIIQPADRFTAPGKDVADLLGGRYGFMVAESGAQGIRVDLARLERLLDRASVPL